MDISKVLSDKYPGCLWELEGESYDGLIWHDQLTVKPTEEELQTKWTEVEYETKYLIVETIRHSEYAKRSDPLFFKWQLGDIDKQEWVKERELIKLENPYPDPIDV